MPRLLLPSVLALRLLVLGGCAIIWPAHADAQTCHAPSLRGSAGASWRATFGSVFATYANQSYSGEYQGVLASASYLHRWFTLDLTLPYYRLVRNGLAMHGVGDLASDLRVVAVRSQDERLSAGPELALSLPSGDPAHDLGMGHTMLMPGGWLKYQLPELTLIAQLAYGRAVGDAWGSQGMAHHHHGGASPIVNPMNRSEVEQALALSYALHERLRALVRAWGAVPVAAKTGAAREAFAAGLLVSFGVLEVGTELQLPLVGTPFRARTLLWAGAQW